VNFLLDTNLVSEWIKPHPNAEVVAWLADADEDRVFISVVTLAELRHGIERLAVGRRRRRLNEWLQNELLLRFDNRILPIDAAVAAQWGRIVAQREALGRPIGTMDAFIAATAQVHELTLATRNHSDFASSVDAIVNPWAQSKDR
jgi:predicted nucleic acid-binding protein